VESNPKAGQPGTRVSDGAPSNGSKVSGDGKRDFATLVRKSPQILSKLSPVNRELERMNAGELKALMRELAISLKRELPAEEGQAAYSVQQAAAAELWRREGPAALEWAAGIAAGEGKNGILSAILSEVTRDLPEIGKQWIERYRGEFGDEWAREFANCAIAGANGRGVDDVLKVMELFKDDMRGVPLNQGTYAEDFDFHRLVTSLPPGYNLTETVKYWAARDKEAAWEGVREVMTTSGPGGGVYFASLFRGIVTLEGDEKAAAWTMTKLGEIPAGSREKAIRSLAMYRLPNESASALIQAMPGENDRVYLVSELAQPSRAAAALGALQALGLEKLQAQALVLTAARQAEYAARGNAPSRETLGFFTTTMDQLHFTPESRQMVEAALPHP
jgi:hypothetical protein